MMMTTGMLPIHYWHLVICMYLSVHVVLVFNTLVGWIVSV